jgi:hypothetical protein
MQPASVGVEHPDRHAEEVRQRARQAQGAREAHQRHVLAGGREQVGRRRSRSHPAHDQPRCVDLAVRMHRLAAPGSGHECKNRAHTDTRDGRHGPNRARHRLRTGCGHAVGASRPATEPRRAP